jgi:hypothetical protein
MSIEHQRELHDHTTPPPTNYRIIALHHTTNCFQDLGADPQTTLDSLGRARKACDTRLPDPRRK